MKKLPIVVCFHFKVIADNLVVSYFSYNVKSHFTPISERDQLPLVVLTIHALFEVVGVVTTWSLHWAPDQTIWV